MAPGVNHIPGSSHMLQTFMYLQGLLPTLAMEMLAYNALKAQKQKETHPMKEYLAECRREWEMYISKWKELGMIDDRPEPAYPYTEEIMESYINQTRRHWES